LSWYNFALWPKKKEKIRFKIILGTFFAVLFATGIFSWILYLKNLYPASADMVILKPSKLPQKTIEIDPKIKEFGIKIDKLDVLAPIIKNVDGTNKSIYYKALEKGTAHYKGTALPDEGSNIFIFGHSSSIFGKGNYDKIFSRLGELTKDDKITIFYQDKEYQYLVFEKKVIESTEVSVLSPTKKEQLTLMTCWPIGTNKKRLIIKAKLEK